MSKASGLKDHCAGKSFRPGQIIQNTDHDVLQACLTDGTIYAGNHPVSGDRLYIAAAVDRIVNGTTRTSDFGQPGCHDGASYTSAQAVLSNADAPYRAAQSCESSTAHGHTGWYSPAIDKLEVIYDTIKQGQPAGTHGFVHERYVSSSERTTVSA